jgi:hypothetical protein
MYEFPVVQSNSEKDGSTSDSDGWLTVENITAPTSQAGLNCSVDPMCLVNSVKRTGTCSSSELHYFYFPTAAGCKNVALLISPEGTTTKFTMTAQWNASSSSDDYTLKTYESLLISDNMVVASICSTSSTALLIQIACSTDGPGIVYHNNETETSRTVFCYCRFAG